LKRASARASTHVGQAHFLLQAHLHCEAIFKLNLDAPTDIPEAALDVCAGAEGVMEDAPTLGSFLNLGDKTHHRGGVVAGMADNGKAGG